MELSNLQREVITLPLDTQVFVEGPAGTGKTTAGVSRLTHMLESGVPAQDVLVITPQRTLALPYLNVLKGAGLTAGGRVEITTLAGLAQEAITLFYPLVADMYATQKPDQPPVFLSLETAQYYMAHLLDEVIERENLFESVTLDRQRLYSQILDNMNKAALIGFPIGEISARLKASVIGDETQRRIYDDVQTCALLFREFCLSHHLMDFSLQIEVFTRHLWHHETCRGYFTERYRHLIVDNVEEDTPAAHDLLRDWLPVCDSALILYDYDAGFRRFLGADERSGYSLRDHCARVVTFTESFVTPPALMDFDQALNDVLHQAMAGADEAPPTVDLRDAVVFENFRYYPEMVDSVVDSVSSLVLEHGVPPREIVIAAPYVSDALQFSLVNRLNQRGIPVRTHRPSRALREENAAVCLLTLAQLSHPQWQLAPSAFDVTQALTLAVDGLDPVRAQLLVNYLYDRSLCRLHPFDVLTPEVQGRVTYLVGERYEILRRWVETYQVGEPMALDHFWSHLFGEVLSQEGFGFHSDYAAAEITANFVDSARGFRQTVVTLPDESAALAKEYVEIVNRGLLADQYLRSWDFDQQDAVLIAPAYSFLVRNTPVDYQFWLNISAPGWSERLYQPLTHPYVLSRHWPVGRVWSDADEVTVTRDMLYRVMAGLLRRCRKGVYMVYSVLGEQGTEQRGLLLEVMQEILRRQAGGERV